MASRREKWESGEKERKIRGNGWLEDKTEELSIRNTKKRENKYKKEKKIVINGWRYFPLFIYFLLLHSSTNVVMLLYGFIKRSQWKIDNYFIMLLYFIIWMIFTIFIYFNMQMKIFS